MRFETECTLPEYSLSLVLSVIQICALTHLSCGKLILFTWLNVHV